MPLERELSEEEWNLILQGIRKIGGTQDLERDLSLIKQAGSAGAHPRLFGENRSDNVRRDYIDGPIRSTNDIRAGINKFLEKLSLPFLVFHQNLLDYYSPIRMYAVRFE